MVTITGSKKIRRKRALSGPSVFVANVGNGCTTAAGTDVMFPDAGQEIQYGGDASKRANPAGTCSGKEYTGGGATGGGSSGTGGENPNTSSAATTAGGGSGGGGGNQGLYTQTATVAAGTGYYTPPAGGQVPTSSSYPGIILLLCG